VLFRWTPSGDPGDAYELLVARDAAFGQVVARVAGLKGTYALVSEGLAAEGSYHWKVKAVNAWGQTENQGGPREFRVDAKAPQALLAIRDDGLMLASGLDGDGTPSYGALNLQENLAPVADRKGNPRGAVGFNGTSSRLRYAVPFFPDRDYSLRAWVCPEGLPASSGLQQVFSAWCRGQDDPLRVTFEGEAIFARIEAAGGWGTPGQRLDDGKWVHVTAVKDGPTLTLYVNGAPVQTATVPEYIHSESTAVGLGFNPLYAGGEHFAGRLDDFAFYARALSPDEVREAAAD
jgi:hypothetical protein